MEQGAEMGGQAWYNLDPMRLSAIDVLGPAAGEEAFTRLALLLGATSPRATTRQNLRRASLGYMASTRGLPFPDQPMVGRHTTYLDELGQPLGELPESYGHLAHGVQSPHIQRAMGGVAPDPMSQPKISSFGENIAGGQRGRDVQRQLVLRRL